MRARSESRRRLLNQAVHGFRQRHPEATVAAAELDLAGTLHVSQASVQKWRAGHPIAADYVPDIIRWATARAGMSPSWVTAFLRACDVSEPALFPGAGPPPDLPALCERAHVRLWGYDRLNAAALHFPRPALLALLDGFLASDWPGLILVAPSGMGKTDFALWLARQGAVHGRPVLICPAAILDGERALPDLLASLLFGPSAAPADTLLRWPLLVVLDGVNESPDMLRLTWQADRALVHADGLRVILTFRPESFQVVRRQLTLSEHLYCSVPLPDWMGGLVHDPPVYRLLPFTPEELPQVYERYRQGYHLQTPFSVLSPPLRQLLRHPFALRLLAEAWAGRPLPESVDEAYLIQGLLDGLYRQGRLAHADIRFLEEQVVSRMVVPGRWRTEIPTAEILADGAVLPVHHPFTRLADAGLLSATNGRLDEPVRFAHEQFYEYFVGRRFRQMRDAAPNPAAFYTALTDAPWFLYGPLRRLGAEEMAGAAPPDVKDPRWAALAALPQPVLAGALEDHCRAHPEGAAPFLRTLWRWSRSRAAPPRAENLQEALLAAVAALGDGGLLLEFLLQARPAMQTTGILAAKDLWATHPEAAQALLTGLADRLTRPPGLPNPLAVPLFGQVFLLSLFDYGERPEVLAFLDALIRNLARREFQGLRGRLFLALAVRWFTRWLKRAAAEAHLSDDLDRDFCLSPQGRAHLRAVAPYVDWETPGFSRPETHAHLLGALETGSLLAGWIIVLAIVQQGMGNPPEGWTEVRHLLAEADRSPPPPWADVVVHGVSELLRRSPTQDPAIWGPLERTQAFILSHHPAWHQALQVFWAGRPAALLGPAHGLSPYVLARDAARLPVERGPVWEVVEEKLGEGDAAFAADYLQEMQFVALDGRRPRLALRLLEPLAACPDPAVRGGLADLLGLLRGIASEDVRDWLERVAPPELAAQVPDRPPDVPTHTWLYYRLEEWIFPFLVRSRASRRLVADLFLVATESESVQEWAEASFSRILRML
ncbi:MAG: NACHT domain-containing protein [Anaerolineae bacterium]